MNKYTQEEIDAALKVVMHCGEFEVKRIRPPRWVCQSCWGTGQAASGVDGGSWVECPTCKGTGEP